MKSKYLAAICIVIAAFSVYAVWDFNGGSFDFSDRQAILIVTDSMDGDVHDYKIGSFPADTLVIVEHLTEQEKRFLRVGDVISYDSNGILEHHRIIESHSDFYYVHGDKNHSTERVNLDKINGVVVGANPILGKAIAFIEGNFLLFLAIMFVICSAMIIMGMYRRDPKEEVS